MRKYEEPNLKIIRFDVKDTLTTAVADMLSQVEEVEDW